MRDLRSHCYRGKGETKDDLSFLEGKGKQKPLKRRRRRSKKGREILRSAALFHLWRENRERGGSGAMDRSQRDRGSSILLGIVLLGICNTFFLDPASKIPDRLSIGRFF